MIWNTSIMASAGSEVDPLPRRNLDNTHTDQSLPEYQALIANFAQKCTILLKYFRLLSQFQMSIFDSFEISMTFPTKPGRVYKIPYLKITAINLWVKTLHKQRMVLGLVLTTSSDVSIIWNLVSHDMRYIWYTLRHKHTWEVHWNKLGRLWKNIKHTFFL